jgi:hypothetical protein
MKKHWKVYHIMDIDEYHGLCGFRVINPRRPMSIVCIPLADWLVKTELLQCGRCRRKYKANGN